MTPLEQRLGFIGAGQMAAALACGLIDGGLATAGQISASDPIPASRKNFAERTGGKVSAANAEVAAACDVLILAVKPQQISGVLQDIATAVTEKHLVVSIAAGVPLGLLDEGLAQKPRLVRVMPNTPCLVGQGAAGYCLGPRATEQDDQLVEQILRAVGVAFRVEEKLLDAVTGLSGSGPAFAFLMIEALSDGGVRMGLPRDVATALAAQTLLGAAEMVLQTGEHPSVLKDRVASPGGTTICGLQQLENAAVRAALIQAVQSATQRSVELGRQ